MVPTPLRRPEDPDRQHMQAGAQLTQATARQSEAKAPSDRNSANAEAARQSIPLPARIVVTIVALIPFAVGATIFLRSGNPVTEDSASYVDCARSIVEGRGFAVRPYSGLEEPRWEPIRVWPPGYPLLIAGFMKLGLAAPQAGLAAALFPAVLFLALLVNILLPRLPAPAVIILAWVIGCMPPFLIAATRCWSDMAYLALSAGSLMLLVRVGRHGVPGPTTLIGAGLLGGLAWCVRNAAAALFLAALVYLAIDCGRSGIRTALKQGLCFVVGWALAVSWLVARNVVTFGSPSPYTMPPSERSFRDNLGDAVEVFARDLSGLPRLRLLVSDRTVALVVALAVAGILLLTLALTLLRKKSPWTPGQRGALLGTIYVIIYVLTVVIARTTYRWGEGINSRHFVPVYWLFWVALTFAVVSCAARLRCSRGVATLAVSLALLGALALQIRDVRTSTSAFAADATRTQVAALLPDMHQVPPGQIVLTDAVAALRVFADVDARALPRPSGGEPALTLEQIRRAKKTGRLWGIVILNPDRCLAGEYGPALRDLLLNPAAAAFRRANEGSGILMLQ